MNVRQLVARTVILVLSDTESVKGSVSPESTNPGRGTAGCFVLERAVHLEVGPEGQVAETQVDGTVWVDASRPVWVQVV